MINWPEIQTRKVRQLYVRFLNEIIGSYLQLLCFIDYLYCCLTMLYQVK